MLRVERPDQGHLVGRITALCQGRTSPASGDPQHTSKLQTGSTAALRRQGAYSTMSSAMGACWGSGSLAKAAVQLLVQRFSPQGFHSKYVQAPWDSYALSPQVLYAFSPQKLHGTTSRISGSSKLISVLVLKGKRCQEVHVTAVQDFMLWKSSCFHFS